MVKNTLPFRRIALGTVESRALASAKTQLAHTADLDKYVV